MLKLFELGTLDLSSTPFVSGTGTGMFDLVTMSSLYSLVFVIPFNIDEICVFWLSGTIEAILFFAICKAELIPGIVDFVSLVSDSWVPLGSLKLPSGIHDLGIFSRYGLPRIMIDGIVDLGLIPNNLLLAI